MFLFYYRPMKINLIAFFADLFNALEINPVKCVSFNHGVRNLNEGNLYFLNLIYYTYINYIYILLI